MKFLCLLNMRRLTLLSALFVFLFSMILFSGCYSSGLKSSPFYEGKYRVGYTSDNRVVRANDPRAVRVAQVTQENLPPADFNLWPFAMSRPPMFSVFWPLYEYNDVGWCLRPFVYKDYVDTESIYTCAWIGGYYSDVNSRISWFAPLYFYQSFAEKPRNYVMFSPLYCQSRTDDSFAATTTIPFLFYWGNDSNSFNTYGMLGMYGFQNNPNFQRSWTFPFFYNYSDSKQDPSAEQCWMTALGMAGYDGNDSCYARRILPFYFYNQDADISRTNLLCGMGGASYNKDDCTSFWAHPFYCYTQNYDNPNENTRLFMLGMGGYDQGVSGTSSWAVPFFLRTKDEHLTRNHYLLSLCGTSFYDGKPSGFWAHPFYCSTRDYTHPEASTQLSFLGIWGRDVASDEIINWLAPLYCNIYNCTDSSNTFITPLGYFHDSPEDETYSYYVAPFSFGYGEDSENTINYILTPFIGWDYKDNHLSVWFFPLFYADHKLLSFITPFTWFWNNQFITPVAGYTSEFEYYATPLFCCEKETKGLRNFWLPFPFFNISVADSEVFPTTSRWGIDGLFAYSTDIPVSSRRKNSSYGVPVLGYYSRSEDIMKDTDTLNESSSMSILGVTHSESTYISANLSSEINSNLNIWGFINFRKEDVRNFYDSNWHHQKHISNIVFPFWFGSTTQHDSEIVCVNDAAFLRWYTRETFSDFSSKTSVFWGFFFDGENQKNQHGEIIDADNDFLFYLYNYTKTSEYVKNRLFPVFTNTKYENGNEEHISIFYQFWKNIEDGTVNIDERVLWGLFYSHQSVLCENEQKVTSASTRILRELYRYKHNADGSKNLTVFPFVDWNRSADEMSSKFGFVGRLFRHVETENSTSAVDILFIPVYRASWY